MKKNGKLIYAASEHSADLLYACGFSAPDPFLWFETSRLEQGIVLSALEYSRGVAEAKDGVKVYHQSEFVNSGENGVEAVIYALAEQNKLTGFIVPDSFPFGLAEKIQKNGLEVNAADGSFFPEREFKHLYEVDHIREALQLTTEAMHHAAEIIEAASINDKKELIWQGRELSSEILRAEINIYLMNGGGFSDATIVAGGSDGSQPHNKGTGQLYAGQPIVIDVFPRMTTTGYWGDMTRTFVKGKAPDIVKRAFAAVLEAREHSKELIKIGAVPADVHRFALDYMTRAGFPTGKKGRVDYGFFHGLGHGLGLDIHENPRLSLHNRSPFQGGEVVTVEPGLYYPQWGGVRLEDIVVVTEDGCECLTDYKTELEIK